MLHFPVENNLSSMQLQCHFCFGIMLIIISATYTTSTKMGCQTTCPHILLWSGHEDLLSLLLQCVFSVTDLIVTSFTQIVTGKISMQYPYNTCDYLLHVLLLKLVKMLAKTPPTHHWTGRPLPVYVYDQHSFQLLRVIP